MSVAKQIDAKEAEVSKSVKHLESLELRLRKSIMTSDEREKLEGEINGVKQELTKLEKDLKNLRKENRKNMMVSLCLFALIALLYYYFMTF